MVIQMQEAAWSAERCAALLAKAKRTPNGWKACCPAHEDRHPSLFLADGDDGVAMVCYAGCSYGQIAEALEGKGAILRTQARDARYEPPTEHFQLGAYSQHWDYRDSRGRLLMRVCRWEQPNGRKDIRPLWRSPEGWKWAHHPAPRPLFGLDQLCAEPDLPVLLVEGEKTASAARILFPSYVVTTWPGGAQAMGQIDWEPLRGRDVVLVPDCDQPGRKAMAWVNTHLRDCARTVRTVDVSKIDPSLPDGWDFADALAEGRNVSSWLEPQAPEPPRLAKLGFKTVEAQRWLDLPYLVKGLFDQGQIVVMWGTPGSGKTFAALHLACHVAAGQKWVDFRVRRSKVLYICAESTRKRLENRVFALKQRCPDLTDSEVIFVPVQLDLLHGQTDIQDVLDVCAHLQDVGLIVVDTLSVTFGGGNENGPEDMGQYVSNIKFLREKTGAAILVVHHGGKDAERGMRGHTALIGSIDAELIVERQDGPPDWPSRLMKAGKLREGNSNQDLFAFDLELQSLGTDPDGDSVTTCVVRPASLSGRARRPSVGVQAKLLDALSNDSAHVWTEKQLREVARRVMSRNMVSPAIIGLTTGGFLKSSVNGYILSS